MARRNVNVVMAVNSNNRNNSNNYNNSNNCCCCCYYYCNAKGKKNTYAQAVLFQGKKS